MKTDKRAIWCGLLLMTVVLSACTSTVVVGNIYDRIGSKNAKRFKSYATFNAEQKQQIDYLVASYHSWHRSTQLSGYSQLLRQIASDIGKDEVTTYDVANSWWKTVRSASDEMRRCNPFNAIADLLSRLSDKQVEQMAETLRINHNQREDEYLAQSEAERLERRIEETRQWGKRGGTSFTEKQTAMLRKTLVEQTNLGGRRYQIRRIWLEEFIALLAERNQPDFKGNVNLHIDSVWRLTADSFPDEWARNERLWVEFSKDFVNSQSVGQRESFIDKLLKTAVTLDKVAAKEVAERAVCHSVQGG